MRNSELLGGACTAVMQCAEGKKQVELDILTRNAVEGVEFQTQKSTNLITIIHAKNNTDRNLLVRSVAFEFLNTSLLLPSQEIKRIHQEHMSAKGVKVGTTALKKESRMNADTSMGLYANGAVRAQAKMVQQLKDIQKQHDKEKRGEIQKKITVRNSMRKEAYKKVLTSLKKSYAPLPEILNTLITENLKLVYQHLGGMVSKLPNGKKETLFLYFWVGMRLNQLRGELLMVSAVVIRKVLEVQ